MSNNEQVSVEIVLKPNDVYHPFMWSWSNLWRWVVAIVLCRVVYDVFLAPGVSLESMPDAEAIRWVILVLTLFIVLGLLLFPYLRVLAMFRKTPSLNKPRQYSFTAAGLHFESEDATADLKWSAFMRIYETRSLFIFLQTTRAAIYIPKRFIESEGDVPRLRQLIRDNFKGKWRLRRA
jgi:hypothetical protein